MVVLPGGLLIHVDSSNDTIFVMAPPGQVGAVFCLPLLAAITLIWDICNSLELVLLNASVLRFRRVVQSCY